MLKSDTFSSAPRLEPRSAWMLTTLRCLREWNTKGKHTGQLSTNVRQHHSSRACVTKDRPGSGTLTVKVPWEVVGSQGGNKYSVMDLGRDSPGFVSSLPPIFRLKTHWLPSDVRTPVSRFCLKTFVLPSWSWTVPAVGAFIKKASETERFWSPQPNTFPVDTQSVNTVPRPSGVAGTFWPRK